MIPSSLKTGLGALWLAWSVTVAPAQIPAGEAANLRIVGSPTKLSTGAWRIQWTSVSGQTYKLQRLEGDQIPAGNPIWLDLVTMSATGPTAYADDLTANAARQRYYRVVLAGNGLSDTTPPMITSIVASPASLQAAGLVLLSVTARDDVGVLGVTFFDGQAPLGAGNRGEGDAWQYFWPVGFAQNGLHVLSARASDLAGNTATTPPFTFNAVIASQQIQKTVNLVQINADLAATNGNLVTLTGNLRIGVVGFSADSALTIDPVSGMIAGQGKVSWPGMGTVFEGNFQIDTTTGWLAVAPGTTPRFSPLQLNSRALLNAREMTLNVLTNLLQGVGAVDLVIPNQSLGAAHFDGAFKYNSANLILTLQGAFALGSVSGQGTNTLRLVDSTFISSGLLRWASPGVGDTYTLTNALFQLSFGTNLLPDFTAAGKLDLPDGLSLALSGKLAPDGALNLTGAGKGRVGGFTFDPISGVLQRPAGSNTITRLDFKGTLQQAQLTNFVFQGIVHSTGDLDLAANGTANLGGFLFDPLSLQAARNAGTSNQVVLTATGTLKVDYLKPVPFTGSVKEDGAWRLDGKSGPYSLFGYDTTQTAFTLARGSDNSGGLNTLTATAVTSVANLPPFTLVGEIKNDGSASLTGTTTNRTATLWQHTVENLQARLSRTPAGVVKFEVTDGKVANLAIAGLSTNSVARGDIASDGSGSVSFSQSTSVLWGYSLRDSTYRLSRSTNSIIKLELIQGSLDSLGLAGVATEIRGEISSDGSGSATLVFNDYLLFGFATSSTEVTLARTNAGEIKSEVRARLAINQLPQLTLAGPIKIDGAISLTLTQPNLTVGGVTLSSATLALNRAAGSSTASLTVSGDLNVAWLNTSLAVNGELANNQLALKATLAPLVMGEFRLEGAAGGNLAATVSSNGVAIASGARLLYQGVVLTTPALPQFTMAANGDFSLTVSETMTAGLKLNEFSLNNSSFNLARTAGVTAVTGFNGSLAIPGLSAAASVTVTGSLNSNGNYSLTGVTSGAFSLSGAAVSALAGGATVALTQNALTLTGNLSGGIIAQVGLSSAAGLLTIDATGNTSVSGTVSVAPLVFDQFRLEASGGGSFAATLGANGLTLPSGARLLYKGVILTAPALPQFTLAANGDFSLTVSEAMTAGLKLNGFSLNNNSFNLVRTAGVTTVTGFNGSLTIPGLSAAASVMVAGSLNSDGNYSLTGATSGALSLNGAAVSALAGGATVTLTQNALTLTGNLSGGSIAQVGLSSAAGLLTIDATGTITVSGTVSVAPLVFDQFRLEASGGGNFTATIGGSGLTLPSGARLLYKGVVLTAPALPQFTLTANGDFSLSVSAAMTAGLNLNGFTLNNSSFNLVRAAGVVAVTGFSGSLAIPGLSAAASVTVAGSLNSNGNYSLTGATSGALSLNGAAVSTLASGATVALTQNALTLTGNLSGGSIAQVGLSSAAGLLTIDAAGTVTVSGTVSVAPLVFDQFRLEASGGGSFTATLGANGLTLPNGARLLYRSVILTAPALPQFTIAANGDFSLSVNAAMTAGLNLNGFTLNNSSFNFVRTAGVTAATGFNGSLAIPGLSVAVSVTVAGSLNSNGNYSLTGATSGALSLSGAPVNALAGGATVALTQNALTLTGNLSGGSLAQAGVSSVAGALTISATGTISASGTVSVAPLVFDQFRLEASNGGNFTATLGATGLTIPSGARLLYKGVILTAPALPQFTLTANGDFSLSVNAAMTAGLKLNGFSLNNSSFNLVRTAGVVAVTGFNGSLVIPGLSVAASVTVAGSLNSNGNFSLTGATSGAFSLSGAAVSALAGGAAVVFNQSALTLTGNLSGGSLAQAGVSFVAGALTISATGTISASGTVSVAPLVFDQFRLEASNGGNFTATLGTTGLTIPSGARLLYKGVILTTPALPSFTVAANGDFSLSVSAAMTAGLKLNGFSINNSSFTLARTAGVSTVTGFNGSLSIPGFSVAVSVTVAGTLNGSGAYSLTGVTSGALSMSGAAVSALAGGATVALNQNALTLTGNLSGGSIAQVGLSSVTGALTISATGTISASGTLRGCYESKNTTLDIIGLFEDF